MNPAVPEITVAELKARLARGDALTIVDVREEHEWSRGNLSEHGARLLPLGELGDRVAELDSSAELVVVCEVGGRSAHGAAFLREQGFARVWNLKGGMKAWHGE